MLELIPHAKLGTVVSLQNLRSALNVTTNTTALITAKASRLDLREGRDYWRTKEGTLLTLQASLKIAASCYGDRDNPSKGVVEVTRTISFVLAMVEAALSTLRERLQTLQLHHVDQLDYAYRHHRVTVRNEAKERGEPTQPAIDVMSEKYRNQRDLLTDAYKDLDRLINEAFSAMVTLGHVDSVTIQEHPELSHALNLAEALQEGKAHGTPR